jgi:NADH:ubiquinone oxidoreductase subunit 6 (subunit J)
MEAIFAAVDLSTVATFVGAVGVLIIGIVMAFKGIDLGKRAVRKA